MKMFLYNYEKSLRNNPKIWHPGFIIHRIIVNEIRAFSSLIKNKNNESVLDFGCGKAPYRDYFKIYQGADIDSENKEPDYIISEKTNRIDSLPQESVENIISIQVIEHILYPDQYVKEIERLLKKKGYFFIMTPFVYRFHGTDDFARYSKNFFAKNKLFKNFEIIRINFVGNDFIKFIFYNINNFLELFPVIKYFYPLFFINNLLAFSFSHIIRYTFKLLAKIYPKFWDVYENTFLTFPLQISVIFQKK